MHKSSLLIAGYYSFLNAGSGSNQSNHLYKLGPIHQGIVERGSKTTNDSYSIIHKLGFDKYDNDIALRERLNNGLDSRGLGDWIDLCGLIAPQKEILDIIKKIEDEKIESLDELNNIFTNLHKEYYDLEWHWAYKML